MAKMKTVFFCRSCGNEHPKWQGKCDACGEWNTLVEEKIVQKKNKTVVKDSNSQQPLEINQIQAQKIDRISTQNKELDQVLGGGLVPGSIGLIGGQPGIGKSTLLLQIAIQLPKKILYVSGEESAAQIKLRADRISQKKNDNCLIYAETQVEKVIDQIKKVEPDWVVIDSVQTMQSVQADATPGSITQIRECTAALNEIAKNSQTPITLIGHITKEGVIAGPKLLEHMVDYVFQFEGDRQHTYRILRSIKNRFGSTDQMGIYEMKSDGLHMVENPSMVFIEDNQHNLSGSAISSTMEGVRPLLIEVQALVASAVYGTPQRSTTGFDLNRLHMLLAVLEKRAGFFFNQQDVFLNIAGGFRIQDPSLDLGVIAALLSSHEDESISKRWTFSGEVGLSGEVRPISRVDLRVLEAERMGFERIFIPQSNVKSLLKKDRSIEVIGLEKVTDLVSYIR